jgi:acetolactate synthase-1/2/3 large subunit
MEALIEQGVDTVFGYPGGAVLPLYDELYRYRDRIRHILVSHEQHAAHAADGYARATGKAGVCLATSGPGATNLVTGIATAYMDSVPLVAITGNVSRHLLGKDSFQEVDIAGITMPVVKHNWIVNEAHTLGEIVREAFTVAQSGRPGPVLIDLPRDITTRQGVWIPAARVGETGGSENRAVQVMSERAHRLIERNGRETFSAGDLDQAAAMLLNAERPVIYAGGGVVASGASGELRSLAERLNAPVALSLMGIGAFPPEHRLYTGLVGMHGTVASNQAAQRADLIIALGVRFSDRVTSRTDCFAQGAAVLHLDIDSAEINKNVQADFFVLGDIKRLLTKLLERLPPRPESGWNGEIARWKTQTPRIEPSALHPRFVIEETARRLGKEAIVATDVGQHQMWTAQFYPFSRPRSFLTSGGLGTMGFGLAAALGAKLGRPDCPVALFTGDGSFRMNCAELGTAKYYGIPILMVLINNRALGMVRQWQNFFYEKRYSETALDRPPDFVKLAEAYGIPAYRAETEAVFASMLDRALDGIASGSSVLIEALISVDELVLPMVPSGKPIDEQILGGR